MSSDNKPLITLAAVAGIGAALAYSAYTYRCRTVPQWTYPGTAKKPQTKNYFGTNVVDNYQWLESPDAAETAAWVESQNKVTNKFLDNCDLRPKLSKQIKEWFNYERFSSPFRRGDRYFFFHNNGLQNQSVLYKQESLEAKETVFLDPNTLNANGTSSLGAFSFSEEGHLFAYGICEAGSDWQRIHVKRVADGEDLPDRIEWVKFSSITWTHDGKGFFYARYPTPKSHDAEKSGGEGKLSLGSETDKNENHSLYYHVVGTPQAEDILIFNTPEHPKWMVSCDISDDGKTLLLFISESTDPVNRLYYADLAGFLKDPKTPLQIEKLIDNFEAEYNFICNNGSQYWFKTNLNAPRGKVILIDFANPARENWRDILPQSESVLNDVRCINQSNLVAVYMRDVKEVIEIYDLQGQRTKVDLALPAAGCISEMTGKREHTAMFFKFVSFTYPGTIFRHDFTTGKTTVFKEIKISNFSPSAFKTTQVWYPSKDGTSIPMYIIHRADRKPDSSTPTYLYGYGGFNISLLPSFSVSRLVFIQFLGGMVAIPNLRGGGEFGEDWHSAGKLNKKQNVFDDMHAAAEYLVREKYTVSSKICVAGGSNGGLLVAACINQRPELYGAAHAAVGVLDMLKFHQFTIGHAWCAEYGNADEKEEDFKNLISYSPVHTVKPGRAYPAVLLTTGDHDDRVVPLHSYKYIATLQDIVGSQPANVQKQPLLIRIETDAGHGAGKPLTKTIEELSDVYGFMGKITGATWHDK